MYKRPNDQPQRGMHSISKGEKIALAFGKVETASKGRPGIHKMRRLRAEATQKRGTAR